MDLTIDTKVISRIINVLKDFAGYKTDLGSFMRIDASEERFAVTATDEQSFATVSLPSEEFGIEVRKPGTVFVQSDYFIRVITSLKPANQHGIGCTSIVMDSSDAGFVMTYSVVHRDGSTIDSERTIPKSSEEKFQAVKEFEDLSFQMNAMEAKRCFRKVHYAVGIEDVSKNLDAVVIRSYDDGTARFLATDGVKLSQVTCRLPEGYVVKESRILIRSKVSRKLARLLDSSGENCLVSFSVNGLSSYVNFDSNYLTVKIPHLKTPYPDCSNFFDGQTDHCTMDRASLFNTLRELVPVSDVDDSRITCDFSADTCSLSSSGYVGGKSSGLKVRELEDAKKLDVNAQALVSTLRCMDSDDIRIQFFDPSNRLGVFEDTETIDMRSIVVPLR